jgi:hypothetical protein
MKKNQAVSNDRGVTVTYQVWDGEGNNLVNTADYDEAHKVCNAARVAGKYAKVHTHREWPCGQCGTKVQASTRDVDCDKCGACYSMYGQRFRDNWRSNMSNYDSDVSDMDGYEAAELRRDNFIDGIVLGGGA